VHVFNNHPLLHSLVLVSLGDTNDQVVLLPVSPAILQSVFRRFRRVRRTIRVRTVRRVATLLRAPWWSSILMTFFAGCSRSVSVFHGPCRIPTYVCEADRQVTERLCELALGYVRIVSTQSSRLPYAGALDDDVPGLDGDLDSLRNLERFLGVAALLSAKVLGILMFCVFCDWDPIMEASIDPWERENCAMRRVGNRNRRVDVHVLHLEGCCGLVCRRRLEIECVCRIVKLLWASRAKV
jgi:hypothetical protein